MKGWTAIAALLLRVAAMLLAAPVASALVPSCW